MNYPFYNYLRLFIFNNTFYMPKQGENIESDNECTRRIFNFTNLEHQIKN